MYRLGCISDDGGELTSPLMELSLHQGETHNKNIFIFQCCITNSHILRNLKWDTFLTVSVAQQSGQDLAESSERYQPRLGSHLEA